MAPRLIIGCCGWSYLREQEFTPLLSQNNSSKLQAYAQLFDSVEVNSTFYRIPKITTAERWRQEASGCNSRFEFTVKAYQGITHQDRFGRKSREYFEAIQQIGESLRAPILLFQSPASFQPTAANAAKMQAFFKSIDRSSCTLAWEPRGKWYDMPGMIIDLCEECRLAHVVDPFRNRLLSFAGANIAYFRLHGFGKSSMYSYDFSHAELEELRSIVRLLPESLRAVYIYFNNTCCYTNGRDFTQMMNMQA